MAVIMVLMKIQVFWDIMQCWLVYNYHSFKGAAFRLVEPGDGGNIALQIGHIYLRIILCDITGNLNLFCFY